MVGVYKAICRRSHYTANMAKERVLRFQVNERTINTCPVCRGSNAEFSSLTDGPPEFRGWCPCCTNVSITHSALDLVRRINKAHLLSAFLRDAPASDWITRLPINDADVESLADSVSEIPLVEQFDRLLFVLCEQTPLYGSRSNFSYETDWPLIRARGSNEVLAMLKDLKADGYLMADGRDGMFAPPTATRKGFERYPELQKMGPMSLQAFVAMAFAQQYNVAWLSIIKPGITAAGYRPFRVDQKEHSDKVDDLIMAEIRRSKFLVADFSGQRGGVYFEAGFAHGLGRPVIWMCHDDEKDGLHFDTRQYNHILYRDPADAKEKLRNRIVAILGEGTYKPEQ